MAETTREIVTRIITDNPKLHDWGQGPKAGGLSGAIVSTIANYLLDEFGEGKFTSLETGAGLSTLVFAAARPLKHIAVNPSKDVYDRLLVEAEARGLDLSSVQYVIEYSENVLPDLAKATRLDLGLIDGGHGWPAVFVDFCYVNMMLRKGGVMIVDDILLFPCTQLFLLLKHQPGWRIEHIVGSKTAFFRKETDSKLMPDFGGQPYLKQNVILS